MYSPLSRPLDFTEGFPVCRVFRLDLGSGGMHVEPSEVRDLGEGITKSAGEKRVGNGSGEHFYLYKKGRSEDVWKKQETDCFNKTYIPYIHLPLLSLSCFPFGEPRPLLLTHRLHLPSPSEK